MFSGTSIKDTWTKPKGGKIKGGEWQCWGGGSDGGKWRQGYLNNNKKKLKKCFSLMQNSSPDLRKVVGFF